MLLVRKEISETAFVVLPSASRIDVVGDSGALNPEAAASSCMVAPSSLPSGEVVVSVSGTSDEGPRPTEVPPPERYDVSLLIYLCQLKASETKRTQHPWTCR